MIKKIFHTADWHLKLDPKYHDIFKQAINNLFENIEKQKNTLNLKYEEGLIVVVGDLFDARNKSTNETKLIMGESLRKLAKLFKVIVVAGNHDLDVDDKVALDSITPVVELLHNENIFFLKESSLYKVDNIIFANFSIFENYARPYTYIKTGEDVSYNTNELNLLDQRLTDSFYNNLSEEDKIKFERVDLLQNYVKKHNETIVGLYHAPLEGTKLDNNTYVNYDISFPPSHLYDCEVVMMGDIHTRQQFVDNGITFVYPASLYQTNYGERVGNQGYALWDVLTTTFEFIDLDSPIKLYTCKFESIEVVRNGLQMFSNCDKQPITMDSSCYIKPIWKDYMHNMTSNLKLEIRKKFATKYNIPLKNVEHVEVEYVLFAKGDITTNKVYSDLKDPKRREDLYSDFLKAKGYTEGEIGSFLSLNKEIETKLPVNIIESNRTFKILNIRGQNFLSFGKFKRTIEPGINLIYSSPANQGGKSNLTRAIMFLLYGKVDYGVTSTNFEDIFNVYMKSTTCIVEGEVEISGEVFFLRRKLIKEKNDKISHAFEIYKYDEKIGDSVINGKKAISLKKRTTAETLKMFEQYVGTLDTFILTSYFTQNTLERILDTKPTERYVQFSGYLGLENFEKKQELAKNIYKDFLKKSVISKYDIDGLNREILSNNSEISLNEEELKRNGVELTEINQRILEIEEEILKLSSTLYQLDADVYIDPELVQKEIEELQQKNVVLDNKIIEFIEKYPNFESIDITTVLGERQSLINAINALTPPENLVKEKQNLLSEYSKPNKEEQSLSSAIKIADKQIADARTTYAILKAERESLEKEFAELGESIICEFCGKVVSDLTEKKRKITTTLEENSSKSVNIVQQGKKIAEEKRLLEQSLLKATEEKTKAFDENLQRIELSIATFLQTEKAIYEKKLSEIDTIYNDYLNFSKKEVFMKDKLLVETAIKTKTQALEKYHKQINLILVNKNNEEKINLLKINLKECKDHAVSKNALLNKCVTNIEIAKNSIEKTEKILTEFQEDFKYEKSLKNYIDLHGKDGIGKYLINAILPTINSYLNNITSQSVDFNIVIDFDNTGIQFYIEKEGVKYPLYYGSGYEKTFACLALHMVNMNMSINLPLPNVLILDETFSTVAIKNLPNIQNLVKQMTTLYSSIDLVTHIEEVKEWADRTILIEKNEQNISFIN